MVVGTRVVLACPAKVNLALAVGPADAGRRGMHPIASWMVAVSYADRLRLRRASGAASRFDIAFAGAPHDPQVDWPPAADLARRAHRLVCERLGKPLAVDLVIRKRIPPGSGLGGGSSDAAATLVALDRLFDLGLGGATLRAWGHELGSDVAFLVDAVLGTPSALVSGLGECVEPLPLARRCHLVLLFPPLACPTAEVYRAFDAMGTAGSAPDVGHVRAIASAAVLAPEAPFNDLAEAACRVRPALGALRRRLAQSLGMAVHVSGSGATLFLVAASAAGARRLAAMAIAAAGVPAVATATL